jgi:hypothetical protein
MFGKFQLAPPNPNDLGQLVLDRDDMITRANILDRQIAILREQTSSGGKAWIDLGQRRRFSCGR